MEKSRICKNCKYYNNTVPESTEKRGNKYKRPEEYIGHCEKVNRPAMMYDMCMLFREVKE